MRRTALWMVVILAAALLGALAGFLSAVFLTLAFMPPTSYLDAVRRRALVEA